MGINSILIDTNFYADIMLGRESAQKILESYQKLFICPIVIAELLYGFKNGNKEKENIKQLRDFLELSSVETLALTETTAEFFALIIHQLRKSGTPIPTHDIWIAACAMEHGTTVATNDIHFKKIPNLLTTL